MTKEDSSITVKCSRISECGKSCPYLMNPYYKRRYKRGPPDFRDKQATEGNDRVSLGGITAAVL